MAPTNITEKVISQNSELEKRKNSCTKLYIVEYNWEATFPLGVFFSPISPVLTTGDFFGIILKILILSSVISTFLYHKR